MIGAYVQEMARILEEDPRVLVLWSDPSVGEHLAPLSLMHPERCRGFAKGRNAMLETAIESADNGCQPWIHMHPSFPSSQGISRIRSGVFASNRNVKVVGLDCGDEVRSGSAGLSDTGIMRSMPGSMVMVPSDTLCLKACIRHSHSLGTGVYVRIPKSAHQSVYPEGTMPFPLGVSMPRRGIDTVLLAAGPTVGVCVECSDILGERGVSVAVGDLHTVKPLDEGHIRRLALTHGRIWAVEERQEYGGVYSAVSEALSDIGMAGRLGRLDTISLLQGIPEGANPAEALAARLMGDMGTGPGPEGTGTRVVTDSEQALDLKRVLNPRIRIL